MSDRSAFEQGTVAIAGAQLMGDRGNRPNIELTVSHL
jgi:hypothetical protein